MNDINDVHIHLADNKKSKYTDEGFRKQFLLCFLFFLFLNLNYRDELQYCISKNKNKKKTQTFLITCAFFPIALFFIEQSDLGYSNVGLMKCYVGGSCSFPLSALVHNAKLL